MQSRRWFFCVRVELVQLARAFLCPSTGHAGTMDRAQEPQPRDSGAQVDRAAPGASCTIYPRPQPPQRAHRATQPGKGTGTQASPETSHRAAHSGAQAQAIHSPGNNTAGNAHKRPTEPPRAGVLSPIQPAAKTPHSGAQSRPQRASRRGYRNAGEGKPTAATAPAQHPGRKSGLFSVIFRAIFCHFSRLCPALPVSFIVGKSKVESRELIVESRSAMEVGAGLIVRKSVNRSVPRLHPPKVAWSGRRRCTSAGFHRLNSRCLVERSE